MNFNGLNLTSKLQNAFVSLLLLCSFLFGSGSLHAQIDTEFWFAAPYASIAHGFKAGDISGDGWSNAGEYLIDGNRPLYLKLSTLAEPATVTISIPASGFTPIVREIPANQTVTVDMTDYDEYFVPNDQGGFVENKGIFVESTELITAYYEVATIKNPDLFALKGKNALGTEFYTPFQNVWANQDGDIWGNDYSKEAFSAIDIVATENLTHIKIESPVPLEGATLDGNGMYIIEDVLHKGQTYSARALSQAADAHPTGAYISADKPIAVTIKDDSAVINVSRDDGEDLIGDQLIPVSLVGTEYIVMQGNINEELDERFFVVATEDATTVTIDGTDYALTSAGDNMSYIIRQASTAPFVRVLADKPIYVFHVSGYEQEMAGAVLPPINACTGSDQIGFTRTYGEYFYEKFFMNILVKKGAEDAFLLDGQPHPKINAAAFTTVGASDWMAARIEFSKDERMGVGQHLLQNTENFFHMAFVNTTVYEWKGKDTWDPDATEIIWGGDDEWEVKPLPNGDTIILPDQLNFTPRLIGAIYGYFSNFDISEPKVVIVNTMTDYAVFPLDHDQIKLRASGGYNYTWKGEQFVDGKWVAMNPDYLDAAEGKDVLIGKDLPEGEYRYVGFMETRCYGQASDTVLVKVVDVPSPHDVEDCLCDDPDGSGVSQYYNLWNLADTILGSDGYAAGSEITGWFYKIDGDSLIIEDYDDNRLVTDLTAGYATNLTNVAYSTVENEDFTGNSSANVGYIQKISKEAEDNGPLTNDGTQAIIELELPDSLSHSLGSDVNFSLKARYDGTPLENWQLEKNFYVSVALVNSNGEVVQEQSKPIPTYLITSPKWTGYDFGFTATANQAEYSRIRVTFGMEDLYITGLGLYIDDLLIDYDGFWDEITQPESIVIAHMDSVFAEVTNQELVQHGRALFFVDDGCNPQDIDLGTFCSDKEDGTKDFDVFQYGFYELGGSKIADKIWYLDEELTALVPDPTKVPVSGKQTYYAHYQDKCETNVGTVTIEVVPEPRLDDNATAVLCGDPLTDGSSLDCVDLTQFESDVCENPTANAVFEWFTDANYANAIVDPTCASVQNNGVMYVKVSNLSEDGTYSCEAMGELGIQINPAPEPVVDAVGELCADWDEINLNTLTTSNGTFYINDVENDILVPSDFSEGETVTVRFETVVDGCLGVNVQEVVIHDVPKIKIDPVAVADYGDQVDLNSTVTGGAGNYSYSWTPANMLEKPTVADPRTEYLFKSQTLDLEVTDSHETIECVSTSSIEISVKGVPGQIEINASDQRICLGEEVNLKSVVTGGTGSFNFTWLSSPPDPKEVFSNDRDVTVSPEETTVYTVILEDTKDNIKDTAYMTIVVDYLPEISIENENQYTCQDVTGEIAVEVSGGDSVYTYLWNGETSIIGGDVTKMEPAILGSLFDGGDGADNVFDLELTVTDGNGCKATAPLTVTIFENPSINVVAELPLCQGLQIPLHANVSGGTMPYVHKWEDIEGLSALDVEEPIYNAVGYGEVTFEYSVTDSLGCKANMSLPLNILEKPDVALKDTVYCHNTDGISALLIPGQALPASDYNYKWYLGNKLIGEERTLVVDLTEVNEYEVSYVVEYATDDPAGKCRDTAYANVNIRETPTAQVSVERSVCQNDTLELIGSHDNTYEYVYSWDGPAVEYVTNTDNHTTSFINRVSGSYDLTYTQTRVYDDIACPSTANVEVRVKDTTIIELENQFGCAKTPYMVDADLIGPGGYDIVWVKNGEALTVDDVQNPIFISEVENEFIIGMRVTDMNNCTSYKEVHVTIFGLPDVTAGFDVYVDYKDTFALSASVSNAEGLISYRWQPDEFLLTPKESETKGVLKTTTDFIVTATDFIRIETDTISCHANDTVRVNVEGGPLYLDVENVAICKDYEYANLEALASGGKRGQYAFEWFEMPDETTVISTEKTLTVRPQDTTEYKCIVYSGEILPDTAYAKVITHDRANSILTKESGSMCFGSTQKLNVTPCDPSNSYWWDINNTGILDGECQYDFGANKDGRFVIELVVENEYHCRDTIMDTIFVHKNPKVELDISLEEICAESFTLIEAKADGGSGAPYIYNWNNHPKIELVGTDGSAVNYKSDEAVYRDPVTVTVTDGNNCKASGTGFVTVYSLPSVPDPTPKGCSSADITVKLQNSELSFSLESLEHMTQNGNQYIFNADTSGLIEYAYTATDARGCKKSSTFEVEVFKAPEITLPECKVCAGLQKEITASSPVLIDIWRWDGDNDGTFDTDGGTMSKTSTFNYQSRQPGFYDVHVQAVKNYSTDVITCRTDSIIEIEVWQVPAVKILEVDSVPYGASISLEASLTRSTTSEVIGDYQIDWLNDDGIISGEGTPYVTTTDLLGNTRYEVMLIDGNLCEGIGYIDLIIKAPDTLYIEGKDTICQYSKSHYTYTTKDTTVEMVKWSLFNSADSLLQEYNLDEVTITWDDFGDYKLCVEELFDQYPTVPSCQDIHVVKQPVVLIEGDTTVCLGEKGEYAWIEDSIAMVDSTFQWRIFKLNEESGRYNTYYTSEDDIQGDVQYLWDTVGTYIVQLKMQNDSICQSDNYIDVVVNPLPNPTYKYKPTQNVYTETWIEYLNTTFDTVKVDSSVLFYWDFVGDDIYVEDEFNATYIYDEPGEYVTQLLAIDTVTGCRAIYKDTITVVPNPNCNLVFPNAFTPNESIDNEFIWGYRRAVVEKDYLLRVYNRWGDLVWQTDRPTEAWDGTSFGKDCKQDVYVYQCRATCEDGTVMYINGDVTLIK